MSDPVVNRQCARVVLRLLSWGDERLMRVLADCQNMSIEEVCEELITCHNGDVNAYKVACIERMVQDTKAGKRGPQTVLTINALHEMK